MEGALALQMHAISVQASSSSQMVMQIEDISDSATDQTAIVGLKTRRADAAYFCSKLVKMF
jgi:hypothetical protein